MARKYEGKLQVLTSPGLDSAGNMTDAVRRFDWPSTIINMPDESGDLWAHFGVRNRGTWVLINDNGEVVKRTSPHPPDLFRDLDRLVGGVETPKSALPALVP